MKDLDKTQVYDLRGITEEQAKDLYEWLKADDEGWGVFGYRYIIGDDSLEYIYPYWALSNSNPTTHISTLFEKSYEQQLQEARKQLDHYKKEVERLENESKPKVGNVCKFWNTAESDFVIGALTGIYESDFPYQVRNSIWFKNAKKVTEQEVIDLLFKKS